jgi:hypothetical protein
LELCFRNHETESPTTLRVKLLGFSSTFFTVRSVGDGNRLKFHRERRKTNESGASGIVSLGFTVVIIRRGYCCCRSDKTAGYNLRCRTGFKGDVPVDSDRREEGGTMILSRGALSLSTLVVLLPIDQVAAQSVSASTTFDQIVHSPPNLVCSGTASVQYSGGVLMRADVQIIDSQGHLKARACNPNNCSPDSYTPQNSIEVTTSYQVNLDEDPSGDWYCVLGGMAELDYTDFVEFSADSQSTIQPRVPKDLKKSESVLDQYTYSSPGDYLRVRTWQVWDNYDLHWTYANFPVSERYDVPPNTNGCNIQVATSSGFTQADGTFPDRYGNYDGSHPIPACVPLPQCTTQTTQTITVAGVPFSHNVTFGCSDVQISRQ